MTNKKKTTPKSFKDSDAYLQYQIWPYETNVEVQEHIQMQKKNTRKPKKQKKNKIVVIYHPNVFDNIASLIFAQRKSSN